jgi:hypothetical protein
VHLSPGGAHSFSHALHNSWEEDTLTWCCSCYLEAHLATILGFTGAAGGLH